MVALLLGTAKNHRKLETKEMSVTEMELKSLLLRKKKTGRRKRKALKREKHLAKIKESAELGESPQENTKQAFQLELDCKARNPASVLTKYFQDFFSISEEQEEATQSERQHWVEL